MFDDKRMDTTYLVAQRGNRFERNGRMVVWGLTGEESVQVCEVMRKSLRVNYSGDVNCVKQL